MGVGCQVLSRPEEQARGVEQEQGSSCYPFEHLVSNIPKSQRPLHPMLEDGSAGSWAGGACNMTSTGSAWKGLTQSRQRVERSLSRPLLRKPTTPTSTGAGGVQTTRQPGQASKQHWAQG